MLLNKLYKVDSKNKIRVYSIEILLDQYRMITGVLNGKEVKSKWTTAKPKNVGKTNATTGEEQAVKEALAKYDKKKAAGYYETKEEALDNPDGGFFGVMLATDVDKVIDKYIVWPCIADPKLDGMRMASGIEVIITKTEITAISRKGKIILTADHILESLKPFFTKYPNITLDGELYNHEYKEDFNTLMSIARQSKPTNEDLKIAKKKLQFHVYDCFDKDLPRIVAIDRKVWLKNNLKGYKYIKVVKYKVVHNQEELDVVKEQNLIDGYEGTITRGYDSIYEHKRSRWLLKHKDFITEEFTIYDILPGKGNRAGIAGTIEVKFNYKIVGCGIRGSHEYAKKLFDNKDDYIGKEATVRHFGVTPDGSLRFPVCIDINRDDI